MKQEQPGWAICLGYTLGALIVLSWLPIFMVWRAKRRIGQWWRGENPGDWPPTRTPAS